MTAFAVCSYDRALSTVVHTKALTGQVPPNGESAPITALCAPGEKLLGGGGRYLVNGGYPSGGGYYGLHFVGLYPSDASGSPPADGAPNPSAFSAIVHSGNGSPPASLDEYAYALCAPDDNESVTVTKAAATISTTASGAIALGRGKLADT